VFVDVEVAMPQARRALITGTLYALAAGLMWGLVFVAPTMLNDYPAALLVVGRYLAFGLIALPLAWLDRQRLAELSRADWLQALKLSAVGNLLYYLCLAAAIQHAGGPLPTMIIGTLPVVIAVVSNLRGSAAVQARDGRLPWGRLLPSLLLISAGIGCVNQAELQHLQATGGVDIARYAWGALLAVGAVACWTWYPIRNADWLRDHAGRSATTWATAQGIATLPLALLGYALLWGWMALRPEDSGATAGAGAALATPFDMPLGPRPLAFVGLMLAIGLFASWLGTLCWNQASQRLPPALVGQLIVFETLAALAYAFVLRGQAPQALTLLGVALLLAGVFTALRSSPAPTPAPAPTPSTTQAEP
jgi:drug/metabolite transporter (DMT)-like permease